MKLAEGFELMATAPDGVARLRELILSLAVRGRLVPQDAREESASVLQKKIRAEKDQLIAAGTLRRDKPSDSVSDEEKPFDLPAGWEWSRLPSVTHDWGQKVPDGDFTYIDVGSIDNVRGVVTSNAQVMTAENAPSRARKVVKQGTVIYSMVRPYLKNIAIVDTNYLPEPIASTAFAVMHPHVGMVNKYLFYCLRSQYFTDFVASKMVGVAYPAINDSNFFLGVIPLPPTSEQTRIVAKVDELMRLCDELQTRGRLEAEQHAKLTSTLFDALAASESSHALAENWSRVAAHFDLLLDRPEAVDALEQTILRLAVRGLLVPQDPNDESASKILERLRASAGLRARASRASEVTNDAGNEAFQAPLGWEWVPFDLVVESLNGYAFKSEWFKSQGVRLVRNANVSHGHLDWEQVACVDTDTAAEFERFALEVGDIVLSLDRPIISSGLKCAEIKASDLPCLLLQRVAKLTPRAGSITRPFLQMWLVSPYFTDLLDPGRSNGVPHISTKQIGAIRFALPPVAEQYRIVTRVQELRRLCADLRARLTERNNIQGCLAEALVEQTTLADSESEGVLEAAA